MKANATTLLTLFLLAGCAGTTPAGTGTLHVYVSNQSFEQPAVDILVRLDNAAIFDATARVEQQHNWTLVDAHPAAGVHSLVATLGDGGLAKTLSVDVPAGGERWVVVEYWNPGPGGTGPGFTVSMSDHAVVFE